jgi:hypothetical protein
VAVVVAPTAEPVTVEESSATKKQAEKKEKKPVEVVEDDEHAKDGVALDELFKMKPEIFQNTDGGECLGDKKKVEGKESSQLSSTNLVKLSDARSYVAAAWQLGSSILGNLKVTIILFNV